MEPILESVMNKKSSIPQSDQILIQPLNSADYDNWLVLWDAYLTFYKTSLPLETSQYTWQKLLDNSVPIFGFGAHKNGLLVGIIHTVLHPNTWNNTDVCYLEDLYVAESIRNSGIGQTLIKHVYTFAKSKNCNRVYWVTQEENTTARKLYDKLATLTDMVQYRHNL